jgi:hypothetical protein
LVLVIGTCYHPTYSQSPALLSHYFLELTFDEMSPKKDTSGIQYVYGYSYKTNKKNEIVDSVLFESREFDRNGSLVAYHLFYPDRKNYDVRTEYYYILDRLDSLVVIRHSAERETKNYYKIEYDNRGNIIRQKELNARNMVGRTYNYVWDEKGRLVSKSVSSYYYSQNALYRSATNEAEQKSISPDSIRTYIDASITYDEVYYTGICRNPNGEIERTYTFNPNWQLTEIVYWYTGTEGQRYANREVYYYDVSGRLTGWLQVMQTDPVDCYYTLNYDELNRISSSDIEINNDGITRFDYDCKYDANGLLIEQRNTSGKSDGEDPDRSIVRYYYYFFE